MKMPKFKIKLKSRKGFTIIELSIVVMIISVVAVGIISGKYLINATKIINAKSTTESSILNGIEGMVVWLDPVLKNNFEVGGILVETPADNDSISKWKDSNIDMMNREDFNQSTANQQPTYKKEGINNLPSLYFDGNDALEASSISSFNFLHQSSDHTVFMVVQRVSEKNEFVSILSNYNTDVSSYEGYLISLRDDDEPSSNAAFRVGVSNASGIFYYENIVLTTAEKAAGEVVDYNIELGKRYILTEVKNSSKTSKFVNGQATETNTIINSPGTGNSQYPLVLGALFNSGAHGFIGYIGELIIFDKELPTLEREEIENYLSQKWNITLAF